ncbi:chloramphenicol phosphotransferase CPT family protein [Brachybacterium sp. YJGR34]|uniref:chloramphenicol phosphotransferase CPT family protein n=1 Tax=Brachybacterium sp. YJGR34 TaxID=2059911 RepID=UPI001E2B154B|nr:chloramphenicol phosphotransferase CPT family protein [Brachybacterium sp. YJGR34]
MAPHLTALVLITGPLAAGKSAVTRALAEQLRADGIQLALVELDAIADMARPTLPDWAAAHRIFAQVTAQWLHADLDLVIAESVSGRAELDLVLRGVPAGTPVLTVALACDVEVALERALADPTRGLSRDEGFLRSAHEAWRAERSHLPVDLDLDTTATPIDESVRRIRAVLPRARR